MGRERMTKRALNVRPLLVWTPTGLSAGTHLSNALNAAPTLDCTISLSATKYRARGIRRSLSPLSSSPAFISFFSTSFRVEPLLRSSNSPSPPFFPLFYMFVSTRRSNMDPSRRVTLTSLFSKVQRLGSIGRQGISHL